MPDASVEVAGLPPDAPRIRALFYREDDGGYSLRFRVYDKPFSITEAFITGNGQGHSIVKLTKSHTGAPKEDRSYLPIQLNVWRNDRGEIQLAPPSNGQFRARLNDMAGSVARHSYLYAHLDGMLKQHGL